MGSTQMYSLSWGEFGSSLVSTVQILRGHGDLVDVTLAAGGRIFPAHKLVLSAASPLLMELLKSTGCQHPVVMLAGVTAHDLEALLQFVYHGEVSIDPNQLPSLLQAAHCLDIQALSPATLSSEKIMCQSMTVGSDDNMSRDDNPLLPVRKRKRKQRRPSENGLPSKWAHMDSIGNDNMENVPGTAGSLTDYNKDESSGCADDNSERRKKLVSDQPVECSICGVVLKQSRNLRRHMALIHLKDTGNKKRKTKKNSEDSSQEIKKEGGAVDGSETDNSASSNTVTLLRTVPPAPLPLSAIGLLAAPMYHQTPSSVVPPPPPPPSAIPIISEMSQSQSESQSHHSTPPPPPPPSVVPSQSQSSISTQPQMTVPVPGTSSSLCDTINNSSFVPTSMHQAMQFTHDSLFRQHQNEMMRNASLYNVTDTREHCAE